MRIACLHLPAFPLQTFLRLAPHRRGAAIAVVARDGLAPVVIACSRAARAAGVAIGMAATTARDVAPDVEIVAADPGAERAAAYAIAEALGALSPRVDPGLAAGVHHAIFAEVPARMRGATFGARARTILDAMGVSGRVGIADDRFTARVAATASTAGPAAPAGSVTRGSTAGSAAPAGSVTRGSTAGPAAPAGSVTRGGTAEVVSVPRGGSAAFLAPLPLALLALGGEVRHMLETLGVRTLGEFAALPPPSVARPEDADWQALARGDGGAGLAAFAPSGPVIERLAVPPVGASGGPGAAIGELAARVAARLAGRAASATAIELVLGARGGVEQAIDVVPDAPIDDRDALASAIATRVYGADEALEWIEVRARTAPLGGRVEVPIFAEGSAPLALAAPVVPITPAMPGSPGAPATPVGPAMPDGPRRAPHRRTRRGKDRPRLERTGAQPALFAWLEARAR